MRKVIAIILKVLGWLWKGKRAEADDSRRREENKRRTKKVKEIEKQIKDKQDKVIVNNDERPDDAFNDETWNQDFSKMRNGIPVHRPGKGKRKFRR